MDGLGEMSEILDKVFEESFGGSKFNLCKNCNRLMLPVVFMSRCQCSRLEKIYSGRRLTIKQWKDEFNGKQTRK
jgi:hypothetical protein